MTPFPIALESSIDTSTPDYDISPFNPEEGKAPHTKNNGIERNGGIKNAYYKKYTKAANVAIQYTKSGKRVEYNEATGALTIDGVLIETFPTNTLGIKSHLRVPGNITDAICGSSATLNEIIVLKQGAANSTVEGYSEVSGVFKPTAGAVTTFVSTGYVLYQTLRIVRPETPQLYSTINYLMGQKHNFDLDILKPDGSVLFSITGLTELGEFVAFEHTAAGVTRVFVVQTDAPNTWTWESSGPTLTALAGYGYPNARQGTGALLGKWQLTVFRHATTSNNIGKSLDMKATTTFTNISLTAIPTSIYYERYVFGSAWVSYATAAGDRTDVLANGGGVWTFTNINTLRSYLTEIVGLIGESSGGATYPQHMGAAIYTVNGVASYIGILLNSAINPYGPPITEVGAIDSKYLPSVYQGNICYRTPDGRFFIVHAEQTGIRDRLQLVDDETVFINTTNALNIVDAKNALVEIGPNAYNGAIVAAVPAATPGVPLTIAARFVGNYGQGVDTGEKALTGVGALPAPRYYPFTAYDMSPRHKKDIYENADYYRTTFATPILSVGPYSVENNAQKSGEVYVQDTILPFAPGMTIQELSSTMVDKTFFRYSKLLAYDIGNEVPYPGITFALFGTKYLFDYEDLFIISFNAGGLLQSVEKVAIASGLTFLCATPIEAWFLSAWDNSLWTFNGGKNVEKVLRCNAKDAILGGAYCGAANEVIFYEGSGKALYLRDGVMTESTLPVTAAGALTLQPDTFGTWIVPQSGAGDICQLVHNSTGATILPLDFQTAYQGPGLARKTTVEEYVLTLYDPAKTAGVVTLEFNGFDEAGAHTVETHNITVTALYDAGGYLRLSCVPIAGQVIGGSIRVYTTLPITIIDATARIGDNLAATVIRNR